MLAVTTVHQHESDAMLERRIAAYASNLEAAATQKERRQYYALIESALQKRKAAQIERMEMEAGIG